MVSTMVQVPRPTVNPYTDFGKAVRDLRASVMNDPARVGAVNRAAAMIYSVSWAVFPTHVQIGSAHDSKKSYHVTAKGCPCAAGISGKACWHREAYLLLDLAGHIPHVDDWQDDELGYFVEVDGFCSRLENRLRRICGPDAVVADLDATSKPVIIGTPTVFRELPLDTDNATYRTHLGRFSSMTEDEINADLY